MLYKALPKCEYYASYLLSILFILGLELSIKGMKLNIKETVLVKLFMLINPYSYYYVI